MALFIVYMKFSLVHMGPCTEIKEEEKYCISSFQYKYDVWGERTLQYYIAMLFQILTNKIHINGTRWYLPVSYLKIHNTIIIILSYSLKPLKIEGLIIQIGKVTWNKLILLFSEFLKAPNMSKNSKIIFEPTGNFQ